MEPTPRSIAWEAPEHHHVEKSTDWFFALIIIITALVIVAILLDNLLFAILIAVAGASLAISAAKRPSVISYAVTVRGIRVDQDLYPFASLNSYHIDEENVHGPQLYIKSEKKLMPLIVLPIPVAYIDDIEFILKEKIVEEELEESFFMRILELLGF